MWPPFGQCMFSSANTLRLKWLARCWSSRFGWKGGTIRNAVKWKVEASKRQNLTIQTNNQTCNQIQREFSEVSWLWTKVVAACCSHAWILKNFVILYIIFNLTYHIITSSTAQGGGGSFKNRKPIGELGCCESGMAERIHWWIERWLMSPLFLFLSLFFSLFLYLSLVIYRPTYWSICLPIYLPIYLSIFLSTYLPIYLSTYLPIYLSNLI